jgi:hypothetical protein
MRPASRIERRDGLALVAIFAVALGLRLALGAWGPLRINGMGPTWILAVARDPDRITRFYGPGYYELYARIAALAPTAPDYAIYLANGVISALSCSLAFAIARAIGQDRGRAFVAAAVLVLDPISIRIGTTEAYVVPIIALNLLAALAVAFASRALAGEVPVTSLTAGVPFLWRATPATRAGKRRSLAAAILLFCAAALFSSQAARIHPVAWPATALVPLVALASPFSPRFRERLGWLVAALLAIAVIGAITSASAIASVMGFAREQSHHTWHDLEMVPFLMGPLFVLLARRTRGLALAGALFLGLDKVLRGEYGQSTVWQSSFDRLYIAIPVISVAAVLPAWRSRPRLTAAVTLVVAGVIVSDSVLASRSTTEQLEYRFLRDRIAALPPNARVVYLDRADKRILVLPEYVAARTVEWIQIPRCAQAPRFKSGVDTYYVHSSLCTSREGRVACAEVERDMLLKPIASQDFPAVPSNQQLPYDAPIVTVTLSRIEGVEP